VLLARVLVILISRINIPIVIIINSIIIIIIIMWPRALCTVRAVFRLLR
jgi:hypothetical protein